jgi:2,3-bisphosphoglycerate-independent phosphoglycerate mutase
MAGKKLKTACGGAEIINAVKELYRSGQTDYSFEPIVLTDNNDEPVGLIRDGDAVIFCCRRGEREIQLTRSFVDPAFTEFPITNFNNLNFVILTLYHEMFSQMPVAVAFPPAAELKDTIGEVVSRNGFKQLRVAESEKFAHVTFFLNGSTNRSSPGEDHICIPSPKGIPFEQVPELSSDKIAAEVIKCIQTEKYAFITVNFPNGDMIGHLENREAKIKCAEAVDNQIGKVLDGAASAGFVTLITADHGILETAFKPDGTPNLSHTHNPVPFIVVDPDSKRQADVSLREGGTLADVAPTALQIMGLPRPELMTGQSLLLNYSEFNQKRKVLLVVLDGWGLGRSDETNNIFMANTPVWDRLTSQYPFTRLTASGNAVGLLEWKKGNSEAGHQTIGAGRIVRQDDARIDLAIEDGSFFENPVFLEALATAKQRNSSLHLITLLSQQSSHGSISYPIALLRLAKEKKLNKVFVHTIFDGRSTKIKSAPGFLKKLEKEMNTLGIGNIASGIGRGLALDRDGDYQKTQKAYNAFVFGLGRRVKCK